MLPRLTFVLGGANSGKSAWAEALLERAAPRRLYLATARAFDAETRAKIDAHRARRGAGWSCTEAPIDLGPALARAEAPVLLDCATMWLTNLMMEDRALEPAQAQLLQALAACPQPVVVVSNEVGQGIVPENALGRAFRSAQGRLNIALAAQAELAVQIVAGLPLVLKGHLPDAGSEA